MLKPPQVPLWKVLSRLPSLNYNPIPIISKQFEEHGDFYSTYIGFDQIFVTTNPEFIQHILQKNHRNYTKTKIIHKIKDVIGNGLLTSDGAYWLKQRRLIQPGFHRKKLEGLSKIISSEIEPYVSNLEQSIDGKESVDVMKEMMKLTLNVILRSLFSAGFSQEEIDLVDHHFTELQEMLIMKIRRPFVVPAVRLFGGMKKYKRMQDEMDAIIYRLIRERRKDNGEYDDLMGMLLNSKYADTGEGMTDQQLRDESLILFLAGHETSANALSWMLYLLSQHPEIEQRLLDEFKEVLNGRPAGFEDMKQLPYTRQVIEESLRLYPPAWIMDRQTIEADQLGEYLIEGGKMVNIFIYGVHHDPKNWPDPKKFDPDRFTPEKSKARKPFTYFPFGGGPRLCIGNNFAMMEMQMILAALLQKFSFEYARETPPETEPMITLRPRGGMPMRIKRRV